MPYESISTAAYGARTNTTYTAPTGIANGDELLLVQVTGTVGEAPDPSPPAGFTLASLVSGSWPVEASDGGGFNLELRAYRKTAASESGDYLVTHANCSAAGALLRFSGTLDFTQVTQASGTGTISTAPSITTADANADIVFVSVDWANGSDDLTPPADTTPVFTERYDGVVLYIASGVLATAGATGDKEMAQNSGGGGPWLALLLATGTPTSPPPTAVVSPLQTFGAAYAAHRAASV